MLTLDQALEETRTGDLWLFRGRSRPDRAIQTLTNAPVNCTESDPEGMTSQPETFGRATVPCTSIAVESPRAGHQGDQTDAGAPRT